MGRMARLRRWLLITVPLAAVAALLVVAHWHSLGGSHWKVTKANFDRIEKGMSRDAVDALLGGAPARTTSEGTMVHTQWNGGVETIVEQGTTMGVLYSEEDRAGLMPANAIHVQFLNGKVRDKHFHRWTAADLWRRVRRRLGL